MKLVNQLLDFRKIIRGKMKLVVRKSNIESFVQDIIATFQFFANKNEVNIELISNLESKDSWFDHDALEKILRSALGDQVVNQISFGWGVMFPDIRFDINSVEYAQEIIFDSTDYQAKKLESWLGKIQNYWQDKNKCTNIIDEALIKKIKNIIRPEFDRVPGIASRVGDAVDAVYALTEDQYRYLDQILAQRHNVIEGGAGTGKTFLAVQAAKRLEAMGDKVLFLCRSPVFSWHIERILKDTSVTVLNMDALQEQVLKNELPAFDILIIDEGQDFLDIESIATIDKIIEGGLEKGDWLFFMDKNNQGSIYEKYDEDAFSYLKSAGYPFPLNENCRNTQQIAIQTMLYTAGDIGKSKIVGEGLPVDDSNYYANRDELINLIDKNLNEWIITEGILPSEITILSPSELSDSAASQLHKRWRRKIYNIDESHGERWPDTSIPFSSVKNYKGLENRFIMLIDLDCLDGETVPQSLLYVAMTRANAYLWIAIPKAMKTMLDKVKANNMTLLTEKLKEEP